VGGKEGASSQQLRRWGARWVLCIQQSPGTRVHLGHPRPRSPACDGLHRQHRPSEAACAQREGLRRDRRATLSARDLDVREVRTPALCGVEGLALTRSRGTTNHRRANVQHQHTQQYADTADRPARGHGRRSSADLSMYQSHHDTVAGLGAREPAPHPYGPGYPENASLAQRTSPLCQRRKCRRTRMRVRPDIIGIGQRCTRHRVGATSAAAQSPRSCRHRPLPGAPAALAGCVRHAPRRRAPAGPTPQRYCHAVQPS